jgi:methionine-S-sulfoxide reductase
MNIKQDGKTIVMKLNETKEIYLAGGCFWGLDAYFSRIPGVFSVTSGYANGTTEFPSYEEVCSQTTGHAETVYIEYNIAETDLETLLIYFFRVIDPTSLNRQGNDVGSQYRTGIYYTDSHDKPIIEEMIQHVQRNYPKPIVVEVLPLSDFYLAEDYHQKYLDNNPTGYCHINLQVRNAPITEEERLS